VVVVGSPLGFADTLSEGIVSAFRPRGTTEMERESPHEGPLVQITAPISPGSSGSPVLDAEGKVLGVAVATWTGGQSLNFAVPSTSVEPLLKTARGGAALITYSSGRRLLVQNGLISLAVFGAVLLLYRRVRGDS
jgi:S1-C subfamily serine protease